MQRPDCELWKVSANLDVRTMDGSLVACDVVGCGLRSATGALESFVLFMTDTRPAIELQGRIEAAKAYADGLANQLIPRDVQGFIREDRTDFCFIAKCATVVAVQICGFYDLMKRLGPPIFFRTLKAFYAKLTTGCVQHPPLVRQGEISDTFIAAGGLFTADEPKVHSGAALELAGIALDEVKCFSEVTGSEVRVQIGISVGGPLLCGLVGRAAKAFAATGTVVEEALALADLAAPGKVLVSGGVKELLTEQAFEDGGLLPDDSHAWAVRIPSPAAE
jgi:class 3 adenylate cyclase